MRIDRIEWFEVNQFVHQEMVNSPEYAAAHARWDLVPKFIVRLSTDEGHFGVGETTRGAREDEVKSAAGLLLGADPLALSLRHILGSAASMHQGEPGKRPIAGDHGLFGGGVYKAMEVAVFDLVGRVRAMRMGDLLGGYCRDAVRTSYWSGLQDPDFSVRAAQRAHEGGYGCIKIKIARGMKVVERIDRMRAVAPELRFILDAMQRYDDLGEMLELSRLLADRNVVCLEDPLPKDHLDWYRTLREEAPTPIALHLGSTAQILEALAADAADIFNCSPASMVEFVRMVDVAGAAGKPCWHGSGVDLGILDLAYIHSCAVADNATIPSDILSSPLHLDDFVVEMPERHGDRIWVPTGPGLGGELDMRAVDEFLISKGELSD